jgi:hypothetical protein
MELVLAYIDPGTGSLVIQALIAGMVAVPIFFRRQLLRIVNGLRGKDAAAQASATPEDAAKGG